MARIVRPFDDRWNPDEHVARRVAVSLTLVQPLLVGSTEQLRLALIVLDGVTELLLRRHVRGHAMFFNLGDRMQELNSQAYESDDEKLPVFPMTFPLRPDDELPAERGAVYLSPRARGDLHRAFDPNVDVAVFYRAVARATGQALKDAHYYRNGAYHRDELDDVALEGIVAAQREAVSELLSKMSLIISPLGADEEDRRRHVPPPSEKGRRHHNGEQPDAPLQRVDHC